MNKTSEKLLEQYRTDFEKYRQLEEIVCKEVDRIIDNNELFVMEISHRVKTVESLEDKIIRKNGKYTKLTDITDLVGIRIICFFSDSVDVIADRLAKIFKVDEKHSIDKRATISATSFGYLSLHYICRLEGDYGKELKEIPFEIQIRTVLQHAWAEIEHGLGYKSDFGVPRAIRREFSQTASILEIADKQFVEIRENADSYNRDIRKMIAENQAEDILFDRVSFKAFLQINQNLQQFYAQVKSELGVTIEIVDIDSFIPQYEWLGITTIGELSELFQKQREYVYEQIKKIVDEYGVETITSNVLLKQVCYGALVQGAYSKAQIKKFLALSIPDTSRIKETAEKIYSQIVK